MSKVNVRPALTRAALAVGLTLAGIAGAAASDVSIQVYGDGSRVRTTGYGHGAPADFVIEGDGNDIDAFAGPCPGGRPSRTIVRGSGQRHVLIAPCIID